MDADADGAMRTEDIAGSAVPAQESARVAPPCDRANDAQSLIDLLSARLLGAHSATAVLEAWCAERGLPREPGVCALRVRGPDRPATPVQRARLRVGPDEPLRYRRVRLVCAGRVLSEADNWYVPGRLTPEMNALLDATRMPFGRVVHPLLPTRANLSLRVLWTPAEGAVPAPDQPLFSVEAVLSTGAGVPFCEVAETYAGAVLQRGDQPPPEPPVTAPTAVSP